MSAQQKDPGQASLTHGRSGAVDTVPQRRLRRESGSTLIEFSLVILPLMALIFLIMDSAWVLFGKATLQHAAREGVRYAVTGQSGRATCLTPAALNTVIQQVVQQKSLGFVPASAASTDITVTYYNPVTLAADTSATGTAGGNIVNVSIAGVSITSFAPVWRSATPMSLSAQSSDIMESSPCQ